MSELQLARQIAGEIAAIHTEPTLRFTLERGEPGLFDSKAGGLPYLPRGMAWPLDPNGMGMQLLAQIDCTALASLPDFPHTGLLQFFHALDDVYGADFDDPTAQSSFRVVYHETADRTVTAAEVLEKKAKAPFPEDAEYCTPLLGTARMVFSAAEVQHINDCDYRAWSEFLRRWNEVHGTSFKTRWEYYQATKITHEFPAPEGRGPYHQLGGYACFTQEDPRVYPENGLDDLDVLLFQMDSDMRAQKDGGDLVMWGDAGVGNFFISREALKKRDFSRVCYNWDCC